MLHLCQKLCHLHSYVTRSSSPTLELSKNFHLIGVVDSLSTGCNAAKFELQTIFERCFEIFRKFPMKSSAMEFLFSKLQHFKLQSLALSVLKIREIPEIASTVKFFFAVADTNRFSTE